MLRGFLALFLVLLIGNPVCCCAFARIVPVSPEPDASLPSCCQARIAQAAPAESEPDENGPASCPCTKKVGIVATDKVAVPAPVPASLPALLPSVETPFALGNPRPGAFLAPRAARADLSAGPPPARILHCVFRC